MNLSRRLFLLLSFVFFSIFLSIQSLLLSSRHQYAVFDEVLYLDMARDVQDKGGVGPQIANYFKGAVTESTLQPFYVFLLSLFIHNTPQDFAAGKLFSLFILILLLACVIWVTFMRWGSGVAWIAGALISFSTISASLSQRLLSDGLFALFYFLAIVAIATADDDPLGWIWPGIWIGLAYLTKGNGTFLLLSAVSVGIFKMKWLFFRRPYPYIVFTVFFAVASFVIVRNLKLYGSPFYAMQNKVFWLDYWEQFYLLANQPVWKDIGLNWYLSQHSLVDIFNRLWRGFQAQILLMIQCFGIVSINQITTFLSGILFFGISLFGIRREWKKGDPTVVVAVMSVFIGLGAVFSFYLEQNDRYIYPLFVTLVPFCAIGVKAIIEKIRPWLWLSNFHYAGSIFMGVTIILSLLFSYRTVFGNPMKLWNVPENWRQTSNWLENYGPSNGYAIDNWSLFSTWYCCRDKRKPFVFRSPGNIVESFLQENKIETVLLDRVTMDFDPFKEKYGPMDEYGPRSFMGWPRCFHSNEIPSRFMIFGKNCPTDSLARKP